MTRGFVVSGLIVVSAFAAAAQYVPPMETFLGYTYVRFGATTNAPAFTSNGGSGQFAYNFSKWLSLVADLGAVHNSHIYNSHVDNTAMNFLFGPRLSVRYARLRPYFQVLFGGVYFTSGSSTQIMGSQTAFAMTAGGGLDIPINKHLTFRPIGLDYFLTRLQNLRTLGDNSQNNLRYTTGLNFTFGGPR
jgi:hypothetical protein